MNGVGNQGRQVVRVKTESIGSEVEVGGGGGRVRGRGRVEK